MTGPDRLTSVVNAYVQSSRTDYQVRATSGPISERVRISSEGLQKSREFLAQLASQSSSEQTPSSPTPSSQISSQDDTSSKSDRQSGGSQQSGDNLEILSLSSSASFDRIHKAYVSAIKQYHPDNFSGFSPEFKQLAEEKSKQIISAYERLTKLSGKSA